MATIWSWEKYHCTVPCTHNFVYLSANIFRRYCSAIVLKYLVSCCSKLPGGQVVVLTHISSQLLFCDVPVYPAVVLIYPSIHMLFWSSHLVSFFSDIPIQSSFVLRYSPNFFLFRSSRLVICCSDAPIQSSDVLMCYPPNPLLLWRTIHLLFWRSHAVLCWSDIRIYSFVVLTQTLLF